MYNLNEDSATEDDVFEAQQLELKTKMHGNVLNSPNNISACSASSVNEGIFYHSNRRRTLAESEITCYFDLPPLSLDEAESTPKSDENGFNLCTKANDSSNIRKAFYSWHEKSMEKSFSSSRLNAKSARKVPFTKTASATERNWIVKNRLKNIGKDTLSVETSPISNEAVTSHDSGMGESLSVSGPRPGMADRRSKSLMIHDRLSSSDLRRLWKMALHNKPAARSLDEENYSNPSNSTCDVVVESFNDSANPALVPNINKIRNPEKVVKGASARKKSFSTSSDSDRISAEHTLVSKKRSNSISLMASSHSADLPEVVGSSDQSKQLILLNDNKANLKEPTDAVAKGEKSNRRSVKDVFKIGFRLSKKNRGKSYSATKATNGSGTDSSDTKSSNTTDTEAQPSSKPRLFERRVSKLEMNVPIEEVFAGINFATMDHSQHSDSKEELSDDDVVEDLDSILVKSQDEHHISNGQTDIKDDSDYLKNADKCQSFYGDGVANVPTISGGASPIDLT